jgi:alpha-galactosidase
MFRAVGSVFMVAGIAAFSSLPAAAQERSAPYRAAGFDISVDGDLKGFALGFDVRRLEEGLEVVALKLTASTPAPPPRFTLKWSLPSQDIAGQWATGRQLNKTLRPDWSGGRLQASMFAREAPVSCLYGGDDHNVLTFAVSDALDTVLVGSGIREEDGRIYNEVTFFSEPHPNLATWSAELRLDRRRVPYGTALRGVSDWWAAQPGYAPASVPEPARLPVYSTWYNYHQSVDAAVLLKEVAGREEARLRVDHRRRRLADPRHRPRLCVHGRLGTRPHPRHEGLRRRLPRPGRQGDALVRGAVRGQEREGRRPIQGQVAALRGSPRRLRGRPALPGSPCVPGDVYRRAIRDWGIDGFKLDFIERLVADDKTVLDATGGRDFASVNEAADRMMTDVLAELRTVKPDVMIEFRQPYIGPLIRKYGNMFRASDCPNSYLANRVKTVDLRLLTGTPPCTRT